MKRLCALQASFASLFSRVCPVPPIPRIRASALSRDTKPFVVPTAKVASILLVIGLIAQLVAMHVAVYASQRPAYVYRKSFGHNPLGDSFEVGVDFDVPGLFLPSAQVVVDVASHMEPSLAGGDALGFRLNYYCNGQYMWTESDNIYAPGDGQDAGPRQAVVPVDIMKAGKNRLVIHVSVDSVAGDTKAYAFSYYLDVVEVRASNREAVIPILIFSASLLYLTWGMLPKVGRRWSSRQLYGEPGQLEEFGSRVRAYRRAFIPSLAMGAVAGALSAAMPSLSLTFHMQGLDVQWAILSTSSYWAQLALLFALMYVVGRGIDLRNTYGGVMISLFIGSATGRYLGYAIGYFASSSGREVFTSEMAVASMYTSLQPVFTGFSALALAYLRNLRKGRTRT